MSVERSSQAKQKRDKFARRQLINEKNRRRRGIYNSFDWITFGIFIGMLLISLFIMSSASRTVDAGDPFFYLRRQAIMMIIGIGAFAVVTLFDYRRYKGLVGVAYIAVCVILLITLIFGTGDGANRWLFGFQPSELAKIVMIVLYAAYLDNNRKYLKDSRLVLKSMLYMAIPTGLIFLEPDLGTSLVFFVVMTVMLYVSGANRRLLGTFLGVVVFFIALVFVLLYINTDGFSVTLAEDIPLLPLKKYQLMRLAIFINPEMDALNSGYHIIQSKIAIGSGGFFGKGYAQGTQVQGNFLPEHHTDFIFSLIGEEFGFFFAAIILVIFMVFLLRLIKKAFYARDFFGTLIVTGVVSMMMFQVFENIGMAMGIMPVTGLPLPFFSYGGTNLIVNMMAVALVFSVSLRGRRM